MSRPAFRSSGPNGILTGARKSLYRHEPILASIISVFMLLAGCASQGPLPANNPAFAAPSGPAAVQADYVIGPLDKLAITVFQVPDLTLPSVQVDASGRINLPLIGAVQAGGKTAPQLSTEIAARLKENYLQSPQVSVLVAEATSQKITVEGAVIQPGVYDISGPTTLLQAVAMARGPDRVADLRRVAIFRTIDGKRAAAVFDLNAIRRGQAPDPAVAGNDVVVVQGSGAKSVWQDVIRAAPIIGVFRFF